MNRSNAKISRIRFVPFAKLASNFKKKEKIIKSTSSEKQHPAVHDEPDVANVPSIPLEDFLGDDNEEVSIPLDKFLEQDDVTERKQRIYPMVCSAIQTIKTIRNEKPIEKH